MAEERLSVSTDPTSFSQELVFRSLLLVALPFDFQSEHLARGKVHEAIRPAARPSRSSKKRLDKNGEKGEICGGPISESSDHLPRLLCRLPRPMSMSFVRPRSTRR
jgi:hypothetical protein